MDERTLNELLECSVCLDRLDTSSKVLPCQHTFCRRCLEEIVSTKQELRCPECRSLVQIKIEDLPSNILLIRLLEGMKTVAGAPSSNESTRSSHHKPALHGPSKLSLSKAAILSRPCARALYNYEAKEQGDLSFKKGDLILLKRQVDENWFHGELGTLSGFFPATYVQVITALAAEEPPKCTALYDFIINDQNEKDCLAFRKDELITVIRRVDEHWAEGKLVDRIGIFPISFVDFNDSAKWLLNNPPQNFSTAPSQTQRNQSISRSNEELASGGGGGSGGNLAVASTIGVLITTASASITSTTTALLSLSNSLNAPSMQNKRHSLTTLIGNQSISIAPSQQRHSMEVPSSAQHLVSTTPALATPVRRSRQPASSSVTAAVASNENDSSSSPRSKPSLPAIYIALYNYKPDKCDEVQLVKGGYYTVSEKCQDGWYKGACLRSGRVGVFPGNYVQMVRLSSAMKSNMANALLASLGSMRTPVSSVQVINRTHSFPKTSPHHQKGPTNEHCRTNSQGTVKVPSRTITNVTQAHTRTVRSAAAMTSSVTSPVAAAPQVVCSRANTVSSPRLMLTSTSSDVTSASPPSRSSSCRESGILSPVVMCVTGCAADNDSSCSYSPKPARRHHKRSTDRSKASGDSARQAVAAGSGASVGTAAAASAMSKSVGDDPEADYSEQTRAHIKHKKEKKEMMRERLTLMKRLASHGIPTKGRKCRSPPPALQQNSPSNSKTHHRTGSEGSIVDGAVASSLSCIPSPTQRKADSAAKSSKLKPLLREKYRCVDPYPPQSDIELELKQGDIVYIHRKRDDGWFKGTHARTGKTGLFPGCFVQKL